jgi:hypothetical protein
MPPFYAALKATEIVADTSAEAEKMTYPGSRSKNLHSAERAGVKVSNRSYNTV